MIFELLRLCIEKGASDLHFKVGYPPILRIDGAMIPLKMEAITNTDFDVMLEAILDDYQLTKFLEHKKLDLGISFANCRFRVNLFFDYIGGSAVFRVIPFQNMTFDDIGLPKSARILANKPFGLILVTGATGAGKSTTLSCYISHILRTMPKTIITIEDPIEYIFEDNVGLVSQRQVGVDCRSFEEGVKGALKTDCDIIMVGEIREPETAAITLTAAESGKLVFATLHSNTSVQAIERFVNLFPQAQHIQILSRLSNCLLGIITQTLVPKKVGKGRIAAFEILITIPMIRSIIADNRLHLISSYQETGSEVGMITLDQALANLVLSDKISATDALEKSTNPTSLKKLLEQSTKSNPSEGNIQ